MTANSAATWLTSLEPMPSASATAMPFEPSSGCAGARKPKKSWLTGLRPLSEYCPTETLSSGSGNFSENTLWCGLHMRGVQREAGEREAADEVAEHRGDLVPQQVIDPGEVRAQHEAGGEEEHVHDR